MIETTDNQPSRHPTVEMLGTGTIGSSMVQRMRDLGFALRGRPTHHHHELVRVLSIDQAAIP